MSQPNVFHAPWEADGHAIFDAYSVMVASVGLASRTRDDAHEIARLIAAAPEGLKLAEMVVKYFGDGAIAGWLDADIALRNAARELISKATGGAQ